MRSNRAPLLAAAALLLFAGAAGLYFLLEDPAPGGDRVAGLDSGPARPAGPDDAKSSDLRELDAPQAPATEQRSSVDEQSASEASVSFDDARWVEVSVALPMGTPADEELTLFATSYADGDKAHAQAEQSDHFFGEIQFIESDEGESLRDYERVRCERSPNGVFRAPFAPSAESGVLTLEGHYVHMQDQVVDLEADASVRLEPLLGGRLQIEFVLPAGATDSNEELEVQLMGWSMGVGRDSHHESTSAKASEVVDLGGLPTGLTYILGVESESFTTSSEMGVPIQPGVTTPRRIELAIGASVRGIVLGTTGEPVEGAEVVGETGRGGMMMSVGGAGRDVTTDADGRFELRGLTPGTVTLSASIEGMLDAEELELELVDMQEVDDVVLRMQAGNSVSGILTWPDGSPAADETVRVVETVASGAGRMTWRSQDQHQGTTAADGRFTVSGLGAGPFELRAKVERLETHQPEGSPVAFAKPMPNWTARLDEVRAGADVELRLAPPIAISGHVVDDQGAPLAAFTVVAREPSTNSMPWSLGGEDERQEFESADGSFEFNSVGAGTWMVTAEAEGHGPSEPIEVQLPGNSSGLTLRVPRSAGLSGSVRTPAGTLCAKAQVELRPPGTRGRWMGGESFDAESDEEGLFSFEDVTPGTYVLVAAIQGFAPSDPMQLEVLPATVLSDLTLDLRLGGSLTGEIYKSDGSPDAGRSIMLQQPMAGMNDQVSSDGSGQFRVDGLAPGTWQVVAMPDISQTDAGQMDEAAMFSQLKMDSVEIVDGETAHVVLGAPPADPVELSGRVTLAGSPAADKTVMAFAEGESLLANMKATKTAEDGTFNMTLSAPGDWMLTVGEQMGGSNSEFPIQVPAAESHHVDLEIPRGRISGVVIGPDGLPRANVGVSLRGDAGLSLWSMSGGRDANSDDEGRFSFDTVSPGTYSLRAGGATPFFGNASSSEVSTAVLSGLELEEGSALDGLELRLSEPGVLRGVVRAADGSFAVDASVYVRDANGQVLNPMSWIMTDAKGGFSYDAAAAGSYTIMARGPQGASSDAGPFEVAAGSTTEVELDLEAGTILRVEVEDGEGTPLRSSVRVTDSAGRVVSGLSSTADQALLMTEGISTKTHRIGPLAPGKYIVTATHADGRSSSKSVSLRGQEERKVRVRLRD